MLKQHVKRDLQVDSLDPKNGTMKVRVNELERSNRVCGPRVNMNQLEPTIPKTVPTRIRQVPKRLQTQEGKPHKSLWLGTTLLAIEIGTRSRLLDVKVCCVPLQTSRSAMLC